MVKDFKFVDVGNQIFVDRAKEAMAAHLKVPVSEIDCKGFQFYLLHEKSGILMSDGLYIDKFNPDDYIEE